MWVRSQYTSELAVLATWVSVLVPWNVVYYTQASFEQIPDLEGTIYFLRFAFFEIQFRQESIVEGDVGFDIGALLAEQYAGTEVGANFYLTSPPTSALFYGGTLQLASLAWTVAALAFAVAFALSLALYFRTEATLERLPVSEVRLVGALLGVAAVGTAVASVLYYLENDVAGTPIPVGVLVIGAFALVLLRTKEVPEDAASSADATE